MVANYDHPVAYVVHVFLPAYLPAMLFRFHLLTYHLYLAIVSLEETFAYSGYNVLPSGLILGGIARRQERHLMNNGEVNFGCFGALDFALGTGLGQDVVEDVTEEVQEEIHKKRGEKASPKKSSRGRKPRKPHAVDRDEHEDEDPPKRLSRGRRLKEPRVGNEDVQEEEEANQRNEEAESPKRRTGRPRRERS